MNKFFVSTPLGFEQVALQEMQDIWPFLLGKDSRPHQLPFPNVQVVTGGFEFEADFFIGLQLNFFLKTAHRILLRMASFKARDLPKFYQKMKSLPWKDYLKSSHVEWEVAASTSRLNNEKRLQESATAALEEIFEGVEKTKESAGCIFIRMEEDLCTISLDTTGEHLHKRGWTSLKGEAPLRETTAALLLKQLLATKLSVENVTLFDPMMGSGTFLTEARGLSGAHFSRAYDFQKWKRAPKLFLSAQFALNYKVPVKSFFAKIVGADLDSKMVAATKANFQEVEKQLAFSQRSEFQVIEAEFLHQDALKPTQIPEGALWMILNPPYGERLPLAEKGGLKALVSELLKTYKPLQIGVLYPDKERLGTAPAGYKVFKEVKINNGGLRCLFTILTRL